MTLQERIISEFHQAQKKGDKSRISVLRLIKSGIQYAEISNGNALDDAGVIDVINKEVKQRRESIEGFIKGNRKDLVDKEQAELAILLEYLPKQMGRQEIVEIIRKVFAESPKEFDPRKYLGPARKELIAVIKHKNTNVLGSANRA